MNYDEIMKEKNMFENELQNKKEYLLYCIKNSYDYAATNALKEIIEFCDDSVNKNYLIFQYVPNQYKTKKMCDFVMQKNSVMLKYIPLKFL